MHLHKNIEDFKDLIELTADKLGLDQTIIEKDYWITHSLYKLSESDYLNKVVIKGGTSLTKCYKNLLRFSEDIDIAILSDNMTNSKIKKVLEKVEYIMSAELNCLDFDKESKSGDYRFTQFTYKSLFESYLLELHPNIRFEISSFMKPHPYEKKMICSMIGNYLDNMGMKEVIDEYNLLKFEINVLAIERTVVEKIVSLIRMSYDSDLRELLTKTRHLYDLFMTYHLVKDFYNDRDKFIYMVEIVKAAEFKSRFKCMYPVENKWKDAPLFLVLDDERIEIAYRDHFGAEFVYGKLPSYKSIKDLFSELHKLFSVYSI